MNTDELAALCERVGDAQPEIRLYCPSGHFIAHVALSAADGKLSMRWLRPRKELRRLASRQQSVLYGAVLATADTTAKALLECGHRRCGYRGMFNNQRLAAELAVYALAGHRKHRLAS